MNQMNKLPKELNLLIKNYIFDDEYYEKNHKLKMRKIILDINLYYILDNHISNYPKYESYNDYSNHSPYLKMWRHFHKNRNYEHQNLFEYYRHFDEADETGYSQLCFETIYELFQIYKHKKVLHTCS